MPTGTKGLGDTKESRKSSGNRFPELKLQALMAGKVAAAEDTKLARIRFITDWKDMVWGCFHYIPTKSRLGAMYKKEVYCIRTEDKEAECVYCQNEDRDISWTSLRYFFFAFVYEKYHLIQDKEKTWKKTEYLGEKYYLEPINAVQILKTGPGHQGAIEARFESWYKRNKTLLDRDYDWCRNGFSFEDTSYDLVPRDEKTKVTADMQKQIDALPNLEETVIVKTVAKPKDAKKKDGLDEQAEKVFEEEDD